MNITAYFNDFLANIRLTANQRDDLKRGHKTLRERLLADTTLSKIIISTFLQGSYRRSTAIRPVGEKRADVDVIVVTNLDRNKITPEDAIKDFIPFLEKFYKGKYRVQGRSIGIELSYVDLDVVVTSAPSEVEQEAYMSSSVQTDLMLEDFNSKWQWRLAKGWAEPDLTKAYESVVLSESVRKAEEWKLEPLWIPDREAATWVQTHPLEQIRFSREKNANTSGQYINVVKALKWWKLVQLPEPKHPKGYPLEHMIGDCCPDGITSVPEGIVLTLEKFVSQYKTSRLYGIVPSFPDRGVPSHNVWKRISSEDFSKFYDAIKKAAESARKAYDATTIHEQVKQWKAFFGAKFPDPPVDEKQNSSSGSPLGGYTERTAPTTINGGRFA